jgi:tRNA U34 5-methylaminomethyl-2-thiouridine-forming methyltransferase MnmC
VDRHRIIVTADGSHTLQSLQFSETFHSTFGAINESMHVFVRAGLHMALEQFPGGMNILEVGFGTGLNALLTLLDAEAVARCLGYTALEAFPLEESLWRRLNFPMLLNHPKAGEYFEALHCCAWDEVCAPRPGFIIRKMQVRVQDFRQANERFNLVYHDAFSPAVQPEMWTGEVFQQLAALICPGGILVSYSSKGTVRRALQHAGFDVEKVPGPKGKREMIRAVKRSDI